MNADSLWGIDPMERTDDIIPRTPDQVGIEFVKEEGYRNLFGKAGVLHGQNLNGIRWTQEKYKLPVIHQNIKPDSKIELFICGKTVYDAVVNMIIDPNHPAHEDVKGAGFGIRVRRTGHGIEIRYAVEYITHQEFMKNQPLPDVLYTDGDRILDL